jgi:hypothetical protein
VAHGVPVHLLEGEDNKDSGGHGHAPLGGTAHPSIGWVDDGGRGHGYICKLDRAVEALEAVQGAVPHTALSPGQEDTCGQCCASITWTGQQ